MANDYTKGYRFTIHDNGAIFEFIYPRTDPNKPQSITIGLEDVRAANVIKIKYDFDRDGYVITMDKTLHEEGTGCYIDTLKEDDEVAFISAWNEETAVRE